MQQSVERTQMILRLGNSSSHAPHAANGSIQCLSPELLVCQLATSAEAAAAAEGHANSGATNNNSGAVGDKNTALSKKDHHYLFLIEFGAGALGGAVSRTA